MPSGVFMPAGLDSLKHIVVLMMENRSTGDGLASGGGIRCYCLNVFGRIAQA